MFRSYVKFPEDLQFQWSTIALRTKDLVRIYHWQMKGKFSWENTFFFWGYSGFCVGYNAVMDWFHGFVSRKSWCAEILGSKKKRWIQRIEGIVLGKTLGKWWKYIISIRHGGFNQPREIPMFCVWQPRQPHIKKLGRLLKPSESLPPNIKYPLRNPSFVLDLSILVSHMEGISKVPGMRLHYMICMKENMGLYPLYPLYLI